MRYHLSIDIGGTFTDLFLRNSDGGSLSVKAPSTHEDLTEGVINALDKAAEIKGITRETLLDQTGQIVHGTTIATNAILENETAKTALFCTDGFRDTLMFRNGGRENAFEVHADYPDPYIPRSLTYGIEERVNAEGEVVTPLDAESVIHAIDQAVKRDCNAVAISLLWAHVNPSHEQRIASLIDEHAPNLNYSLSHRVNPIIREYRRTSATAIDASLKKPIATYLSRLRDRFEENGYTKEPLLITANGGVMQFDDIVELPIWSVDSGPTMLPSAAMQTTRLELETETPNVIALDMGGTSLDMSLIREGNVSRTRDAEVADSILGIEKVDVKSIGSGGGSIAWVDEGGLLHVGPESAGSSPGPVCYGQGGEQPTITDAALVLGYLSKDQQLGGEVSIDLEAAENAINERIAAELGVSTIEAAHTIYATANQDMITGMREITIGRGIDPREYVVCGGGGALGLHVVPLARQLGVGEIILPREAGVISAIGGSYSDIRHDFSATQQTKSETFELNEVNETLRSLTDKSRRFLDSVGADEADRDLTYYTEARYSQQAWEVEVAIPSPPFDRADVETLINRFHESHESTYGYRMDDQEIKFIHWRVEASAQTDDTQAGGATRNTTTPDDDAFCGRTPAYFGTERVDVPRYHGPALAIGRSIDGAAVIETKNTTIVLPQNSRLDITARGNYRIQNN
jgi:N-methylhydantoinase A